MAAPQCEESAGTSVLQENKAWGRAQGGEVGRSGRKCRLRQVIAKGQQPERLLGRWWSTAASSLADCGGVL